MHSNLQDDRHMNVMHEPQKLNAVCPVQYPVSSYAVV